VGRQGAGERPKPASDEAGDALSKSAEAALETDAGKALIQRITDDPLVKKARDIVMSPVGIALGAAGVGVLAATGKELPFQPPSIPLDRIVPGLSAKITYKGPVNAPTDVGLTLTYREQGPAARPGRTASERYEQETARLAAAQQRFRAGLSYAPGSQEARDEQALQESIARLVASQSSLPGFGRPLIPLQSGGPTTTATPATAEQQRDDQPLQRSNAAPSAEDLEPAAVDGSLVDVAISGPGRPMEPPVRRSMEARFGYDLSAVRIHDDPAASHVAHLLDAAAFTVGRNVVFGSGRYSPASPAGGYLLAHELAHVVQAGGQAGEAGPIHRFFAYSPALQASGSSSGWLHPAADPLRVSDDGQMAVDDNGWGENKNKRAWTTPALVSTANGVLNAQGSRANLRAAPGGSLISGHAPASGAASTLVEIEPYKPAGGGPFDLAADCGTAARQVIGSGPAGRDVAVLNQPAEPANSGTGGAIAGGILGALGGAGIGALIGMAAGPVGAAVGAVIGGVAGLIGGIFAGRALGRRAAQPAREQYLTPRSYHGGNPTTPEEWTEEMFREEFGPGLTRDEAYEAYARLSSSERDDFDRRHGINRYATPRIGQGLTVSTEKDMPGFARLGRTWNFHYAATVLTSGPDYVTLENAAGWDPQHWIFYMYGTALGQSFDEEQGSTGTHGTRHTTFVVQPEKTLDVHTVGPTTILRTETSSVSLPAGTSLRVIERLPNAAGAVELRVRVVGGAYDGTVGHLAEAAVR
jgi:hypothetical protein